MESLLKDIKEELKLNQNIENELICAEKERLSKAIEVALKGIKFRKVYSLEGIDPQYGNYKKEYLKDKEKKEKKIIFIETFRSLKDNHCNNYMISLVLDSDGKFHVVEKSNLYDCTDSILERKIIREDIDVFNDVPMEDKYFDYNKYDENKWDIDNIFKVLECKLEERLSNLKERNKKQKERIEKIRKVLI